MAASVAAPAPAPWRSPGGTRARRGRPTTSRRPCRVVARATSLRRPRETLMTIKNVGVIGCGLMGSGIAQVAAQAGFPVLFVEASAELVKRGLSRLREVFEGLAAKGKLDAATKDAALARIGGTPRLEDLKGCDLVVEAMTENQQLKNETFAK